MTIRWPLTKLALMIVVAVRVITWDDPVVYVFKGLESSEPLAIPPSPSVASLLATPRTAPPDLSGVYW